MNTFKVWCPQRNVSYEQAATVEADGVRDAACKWAQKYDLENESPASDYDTVDVLVCANNRLRMIIKIRVTCEQTRVYSAGFYVNGNYIK